MKPRIIGRDKKPILSGISACTLVLCSAEQIYSLNAHLQAAGIKLELHPEEVFTDYADDSPTEMSCMSVPENTDLQQLAFVLRSFTQT